MFALFTLHGIPPLFILSHPATYTLSPTPIVPPPLPSASVFQNPYQIIFAGLISHLPFFPFHSHPPGPPFSTSPPMKPSPQIPRLITFLILFVMMISSNCFAQARAIEEVFRQRRLTECVLGSGADLSSGSIPTGQF